MNAHNPDSSLPVLYFTATHSFVVTSHLGLPEFFKQYRGCESLHAMGRWLEFLCVFNWWELRCLVAPTRRGYFTLCTTLHQCGPTLGAKVCHRYYSFSIQLLSGSSLGQQSAFRLLISGGDSSYSWVFIHALDCNLGKEWAINISSSCEEFRAKGNTPDFILEHFIVLFLDDTWWTPTRWEVEFFLDGTQWSPSSGMVESNNHGYSAQPHSELKLKLNKNPAKCTINKSYNHIQSYCYNCSTLSGRWKLTGGCAVRRLPEHSK